MVQEGGKKKKNKNKNKKKNQVAQNDHEHQRAPVAEPEPSGVQTPPPTNPTKPLVNGIVTNPVNKEDAVLKNLAAEASHFMNYNYFAIQEAESRYQTYLAASRKAGKVN